MAKLIANRIFQCCLVCSGKDLEREIWEREKERKIKKWRMGEESSSEKDECIYVASDNK